MKTVRVRIAVAVGDEGNWNSCGFTGADDQDNISFATETIEDSTFKVYWLEADLPIPEGCVDPAVRQAEVKEAE